ncbi:kinesin-like protein KIF2C isoform 3 [Mucor ambiguus]|uniref:Kinesin-like protein n=1 Tax=Mucor ambiguus TaxID=91626 RepID=A0A0C9LYD4_9FUNG|nr:kinesin-like protein KIF2C isoform 3 [Mucor ambiguus]
MYSPRKKPVLKNPFDISASPNKYNYNKSTRKRCSPSPKRLTSATSSTQLENNDMSLDEYVESKRKRAKLVPPTIRQQPQAAPHIPSHPSVNTSKSLTHPTSPSKRRPTYPPSTTTKFNRTSFTKKPTLSNNSIRTTTEIKPSTSSPKITVCVRKRPLNKYELSTNQPDVTELTSSNTIEIHAPKQKVDLTNYTVQHAFTFDHVFDCHTSNQSLYQQTTLPLVEHMFQGGKATCFAYGQTGSGKTFTMLDPQHGLYFKAIHHIFDLLKDHQYAGLQTWVGYYEVYQGQLLDLLNNRKKLIPREDGKGNIVIAGLKEHRIHSLTTLKQVFEFGNRERSTSKTQTNDNSSRSHAVLQILLKNRNSAIHGKMNFIDLAGSERGSDRGRNTDTKTRLEGAEINRSLLALKECIRALDQDKGHAPFRGSKLTMVLRDSFVGNSKTCMIATISPNQSNSDHTLNTLRYANRVKELRGETDPRLFSLHNTHLQPSTIIVSKSTATTTPTIISNNTNHKMPEQPSLLTPATQEDLYDSFTIDHVKDFIRHHRTQVKAMEAYLRGSAELLNHTEMNLRQSMSRHSMTWKRTNYKNELIAKSDQALSCIEGLKAKIREELEDEEIP